MTKTLAKPLQRNDVIRRILEMDASGVPLTRRKVREVNRELELAALCHFGCWGRALAAAGFNDETVAHRRRWTEDRVIRTIRQFGKARIALNDAVVRRVDRGLLNAARKRFGAWDSALAAAGYGPKTVRVARRPWTRTEIITAIRAHMGADASVSPSEAFPVSARMACRRLFGSWKAACQKARVQHPVRRRRVWSEPAVIAAIHARMQAGKPVNCTAVARQARGLYDAACHCFGKWEHALRAAGVDPAQVRRARPAWTALSVIAEIRRRTAAGMDMGKRALHPGSLVLAGRRFFGSWQNAIETAREALRLPVTP